MAGTPSPITVSTKQQRIAELARQMPERALTSLSHHIDLDWMREAWSRTRKDGAAGVDEQTADEFEQDLEGNLQALLDGLKSGTYRAPAVRRVYIPKTGGKHRPIGIPTLADKVAQRAVVMALEPVYEQDFLSCSYGFRPGRNAHQALQAIWEGTTWVGGGWVLDADIKGFFDALDHRVLHQIISQRVADGVLRRLIGKWLNAGVQEGGVVHYTDSGTPQGGVISPLLANIYLHEVLDMWFEWVVKPRLQGRSLLIRYADDFVICFEREDDAKRVLAVLPQRFRKYGLELHPDKTRLVRFARPTRGERRPPRDGKRPETFDFLGFTHYWGRSRRGYWVVKRRTARDRLARSLKRITQWLWWAVHFRTLEEQHRALCRKMQGHYGYYGITGNADRLHTFWHRVLRAWKKMLGRRSQRAWLTWPDYYRILQQHPLPPPRVVHSVYRQRANP